MKPALFVSCALALGVFSSSLRADQLLMQNGDRYTGKVLSMSAEKITLQNDVLGRVELPRAKVASLVFGTNTVVSAAPAIAASTQLPANLPKPGKIGALTNGNSNVPATASDLSANSDLARQVREQLLAGSPEATGKYNEMIEGFMSGKLDVNDIRREAKLSAEQLRKYKAELGPEAGDLLDGYLEILDGFLNESGDTPAAPAPTAKPKTPVR